MILASRFEASTRELGTTNHERELGCQRGWRTARGGRRHCERL